jgi:hypothetical protein
MKRPELQKEMKSWKTEEIRSLLVYIFFGRNCGKEKVIEAIMSVCSDQEINNGLAHLGKGERLV